MADIKGISNYSMTSASNTPYFILQGLKLSPDYLKALNENEKAEINTSRKTKTFRTAI